MILTNPSSGCSLQQQPVVMQQVQPAIQMANPDYAYEFDAIKAMYQRYVTIKLDAPMQTPQELSSRGLSDETFKEVVARVKKTKSKSNTNKALLWTSCICCCGLIGWLLVDRRSVGNKKLSTQLAPLLEAMNQELGNNHINVRFAWTQGTLRGYFR
jgi:hypothetical protein